MNPPRVPNHERPSHLPSHTISLGHPSAPAPSILYPASNLDWQFIPYMIVYMFQCHSPKSSHPLPLPQSPKDCFSSFTLIKRLWFLFAFCFNGGVIYVSEVIDISSGNLDSSLCFIQPSISHMLIYMFQYHSPKSSHPLPLPQSPKVCSIHMCLFCCLAYRVIITIFLNSIYMH